MYLLDRFDRALLVDLEAEYLPRDANRWWVDLIQHVGRFRDTRHGLLYFRWDNFRRRHVEPWPVLFWKLKGSPEFWSRKKHVA